MAVHVADDTIDKWDNQIAVIRLTGACPRCDAPVGRDLFRNPNGDRIADWECTACHEQWIARCADLPGRLDHDYRR